MNNQLRPDRYIERLKESSKEKDRIKDTKGDITLLDKIKYLY